MTRIVLPLLVLTIAAMLLLAPVSADAACGKRCVARYEYSIERLIRQRDKARRQRDSVAEQRDRISASLWSAQYALGQAEKDIAALEVARDNALAGLPAAILAVPNDQIWPMVLDPMRNRSWPCDTYYTSTGYWSVDFANLC